MNDKEKTKKELIQELERLRWKAGALEKSKERLKRTQQQVKERTAELAEAKNKLKKQARERKQIEVVLSDSEERFRNLSEQSPNMIFINQGGDILYANQKCSDAMGYKREEFYHPDFDPISLVAPESRDLIRVNFERHQRGEEIPPYEYKLKTKSGDLIDAIITTKLIQYSGETATLGIITDITERKRAEKALQESEERYRSFVQNFRGIAYRSRMNFIPIFFHGAVEQITGYREEEFVAGKPRWDQIIHPEDLHALFTEDEDKLHKIPDYSYEREYRIIRKDGAVRWVHDIIQNVCDESGKPAMVQGAIYDITERKRSEEELMRAREEAAAARMARETIDGMIDSVVITDLEGRIIQFNRASAEIFGYGEETIGRLTTDYLQEEEKSKFFEVKGEILKIGTVKDVEFEANTRDGQIIPISANASLLKNAKGEPAGMIAVLRDITVRKRAEKALLESEERFRTLFASSPDAIFVEDLDGVVLDVNPSACLLQGMTRDEIVGKHVLDLVPAENREEVERTFPKLVSGKIDRTEGFSHNAAGNSVPVEIRAKQIEYGGKKALLLHVRDITERKEAEEEILKFKTISDKANYGVAISDLEGNIEYLNDYFASVHGYKAEELINRNLSVFHNDEQLEEVTRINEELKNQGSYSVREVWHTHRNGTEFPMLMNATIIKGLNDKPLFLAATALDITDLEKAREALRRSEAEMRSLVDNSPDIITILDSKAIIRFINRTHSGIPSEDVIGKSMFDLLEPEIHGQYRETLEQVFRTGEIRTAINKGKDQKNQTFWFEDRFVPIIQGDNVDSIMLISTDISERKEAEVKLTKTMEALKVSNADLEQFAYAASHDLMAPLSTISGYVQLLAHHYMGRLDADADRYIERTVHGVENMQALVEDILSFSRLVKQERPEKHIDLNTILGQVLSNLNRTISDSGAVITNNELPIITADRSQLVQLFQNIIGNAVKFRGDDQPRIHVSAERKDDEWLFSISDNGIGIEPRFRERIFILFQQLETEKTYPGTGMGLALCKKIVERHGGRIWVDSVPGQGSSFYFTLPCKS